MKDPIFMMEESNPSSGYDAQLIARHFDGLGMREWERLTQTPAHEVTLYIHSHYLEKYISKGKRVLEIGAGAGRFTQILARLGAQITVADISSVQLELNNRFASEFGFDQAVLDRRHVDICDLSQFESNSFDDVVAYGGPLSYVLDKRNMALDECLRVLRPDGLLILSVMSLWGSAHGNLLRVLETPVTANEKITTTGDISPKTFPERNSNFMHLFRAHELKEWLSEKKLQILDLSASSCLALTWGEELKEIRKDAARWNELLRMEMDACTDEGCLGMGTHLIAVVKKSKRKSR
jgi:2-polyprenyl-3-methyl-5-hydroxy-6-metoxy-1,4-benzoquinol methylase